jgi:predicted small secreted protein
VKRISVLTVALGACVLAGCEHRMTLEEARAACTKQGGFLVVLHTQKVTMSGVGPEIDSPGDCVSPDKFDNAKPSSENAAKPAN